MKINNLSYSIHSSQATLSADIIFRNKPAEKMYFSTDTKNEEFISQNANPFLAALLLPAMKLNEDIEIEGIISEKLLNHSEKIMDLIEKWDIGLKRIKIKAASTSEGEINKNSNSHNSGSFFSAGVDSFYTYLKYKNDKNPISVLILIHGFDIPLKNKQLFQVTKKAVEDVAKIEKIDCVSVETNAGEIAEKYLIWDFSHGGALAAVGLFLGAKLDKIYISGGLQKDEVFPYGTHPDLDPLWSSENTNFFHDGTEYNRLGKIINSISKSDLALKNLRVCTQNIKGKYNCGRCYKCLQTMIGLVCANALTKATTFGKLDLNAVRNMHYDYKLKYNLQGEANLELLRKQNREPELQEAIEQSLITSKKIKMDKLFFQKIASLDQKYNDRKLYRLVFDINKDQDRNRIFKFLSKIGALK